MQVALWLSTRARDVDSSVSTSRSTDPVVWCTRPGVRTREEHSVHMSHLGISTVEAGSNRTCEGRSNCARTAEFREGMSSNETQRQGQCKNLSFNIRSQLTRMSCEGAQR
jgi:hypothetical protein